MRLLMSLIAVAIALGCGVAWHHWYDEHHISSPMRQSLTAACDPSASDDDINSYVRNARLQVHTSRDAALLAEFQQLMRVDEQTIGLMQIDGKQARASAHQGFTQWNAIRQELDLPVLARRH